MGASKIVYINGGTGFVGRALCSVLLQSSNSYQLFVQTRRPSHHHHKSITFLHTYDELPKDVCPDILINLSGAPIAEGRWTYARRQELLNSRVRVTQMLRESIQARGDKIGTLINASAVGYYGDCQDELVDESANKGAGFAAELCEAWEEEALKFQSLGTRVVALRIGVVLGQGGGFLAKMMPIYKLGLGGAIGKGLQWLSWIHLEDLVQLILTSAEDERYQGVFNATSPSPIQQRDFARMLASKLHRPAIFYTSKTLLKLIYGDMAKELLLSGQRVIPAAAENLGFQFKYPDVESALGNILAF